jgi:hypothetical protein
MRVRSFGEKDKMISRSKVDGMMTLEVFQRAEKNALPMI